KFCLNPTVFQKVLSEPDCIPTKFFLNPTFCLNPTVFQKVLSEPDCIPKVLSEPDCIPT
ncbi:hypothetical protein NFI96_020001, partial [Prochilodus magdalenae]